MRHKVKHRRYREIKNALDQAGLRFRIVEMTNAHHVRITLDNGRKVFTGATPSDHRTLKKMVADARKEARV